MFGYVRPYKPELLVKEYQAYKSVYCGLCKSLGKEFGLLSRTFLSYDAAFLVLLSISINSVNCVGSENTTLKFYRKSCVVNPLKKCLFCECQDKSFSLAGAVSIIMTYYKIKDDIHDSSPFKKLLSCSSVPLILKSYNSAKRAYPEIEAIISDFSQEQKCIERQKDVGIDLSAKPTADALAKILPMLTSNSNDKRILAQFGFFLGRWIYLMDAADDIDKDIKSKNFNPFVNDLIVSRNMTQTEVNNYCNQVLNQTMAQLINAFNLLNLYEFKSILGNIIFKGMPNMQNQILSKVS